MIDVGPESFSLAEVLALPKLPSRVEMQLFGVYLPNSLTCFVGGASLAQLAYTVQQLIGP